MTPLEGKRPKLRIVLLALGAVVVAVTLFRVPLATVFTLGVLLICPLLMIGMHGGGHGAEHSTADEGPIRQPEPAMEGGASARRRASSAQDLGPGRGDNQRRDVQSSHRERFASGTNAGQPTSPDGPWEL
jgi:Protein of unknown function (DUF2933)